MENRKDNPGVYIPPPILYIIAFLAAMLIQGFLPLDRFFFSTALSKIVGATLILTGLFFSFPALRLFFKTKNTLVTIKPANTLQTGGVYSISRNPMYLGLMLIYTGLSFIAGNWWCFVLLPLLFFSVQVYVIRREEQYLCRRFGQAYLDYQLKVRRWI